MTQTYEINDMARSFMPKMNTADRKKLERSIQDDGFWEDNPIKIWKNPESGKYEIIDGRNRYEACMKLGVTPVYRVFEGDEDAARKRIYGMNVARRHMKKYQIAASEVLRKDIYNIDVGETSEETGVSKDIIRKVRGLPRESLEKIKKGESTVEAEKAKLKTRRQIQDRIPVVIPVHHPLKGKVAERLYRLLERRGKNPLHITVATLHQAFEMWLEREESANA